MTWLKYLGPLIQLIAAAIRFWIGRAQKQLGKLEAENVQAARDIEILRKASDARRSVRSDPERLRDDPRNRDAG